MTTGISRRLAQTFTLFALTLSLAAATQPLAARVPIGTLAGQVLDAKGSPVDSAAVTIQTSDGLEPFATHTDITGHFRIMRLETGPYDLRASYGGHVTEWTKRVMVHANKTTEVTLQLAPDKA